MRILVIRTDRIGDSSGVLLSTPVLGALREQDGGGRTAMRVSPYAAGAIEGHPDLAGSPAGSLGRDAAVGN